MTTAPLQLPTVETLLHQMHQSLKKHLKKNNITRPRIVGIHTGGAWIAERIQKMLAEDQGLDKCPPMGTLNIAFYRDDFTERGMHPVVTPSTLPFDVEDANLILIDDVLKTGRTIRAALNELFDYGRPETVTLAVLVDLGARQLPMSADAIGANIQLPKNKRLKLQGPERLKLTLL